MTTPTTIQPWPAAPAGGRGRAQAWDLARRITVGVGRRLAPACPKLCLAATALVERLASRATGALRAADLEDLLGPLAPATAGHLARTVAANEGRRQLLYAVREQYGLRKVDSWVADRGLDSVAALHRQGRGAILMFCHQTATEGIAPALCRHDFPVLVIRTFTPRVPYPSPLQVQVVDLDNPTRARQGLRAAVNCLRQGVSVLLAVDGDQGQPLGDLPFLNGALTARGGLAFMYRKTGAAVVPITAHWRPAAPPVLVTAHPPQDLPPADGLTKADDPAVMALALAWVENQYRQYPEQLRVSHLRRIWRPGPRPGSDSGE